MSNSALHFFVKAATGENASIPTGKSACQTPFYMQKNAEKVNAAFFF
jgi:hypothetical protein